GLGRGVRATVVLIFSLERCRQVMDADLAGMELARSNGHALSRIQAVAAFFVSRVDAEVDKRLKAIGTEEATALLGRAAIANARLALQAHEEDFDSKERHALTANGALPQRTRGAYNEVKH